MRARETGTDMMQTDSKHKGPNQQTYKKESQELPQFTSETLNMNLLCLLYVL